MGFPAGASGKEPACQCRRCKRAGFDPWVRKIPEKRAWHRIKNFDFKTEHQNIIIIGKCCRGKTSLAVDISLEAIEKGAMVVYVTFEELIKCSSKKSHPWRYLVESDLVVIDELFYTTPTEEELLLFYKAIMKLSNERSLILISNRDLPLWNEMKADRHVIETLSARLSHNSQMIYL